MATVSFQVIDGVDKGRCFVALPTPVTIGREEGNAIRLNDERVSRFHAKVQEDQGQVVLTDLDSTNGTCVNGEAVQLRLLRIGDRVAIGRSTLLFGTMEEIGDALSKESNPRSGKSAPTQPEGSEKNPLLTDFPHSEVDLKYEESRTDVFRSEPPKLPTRLSPAQAAQLSEVIDFLHRALAVATEQVHIPPKSREARLPMENWQQVQAVLTFLSHYSREVAEPGD